MRSFLCFCLFSIQVANLVNHTCGDKTGRSVQIFLDPTEMEDDVGASLEDIKTPRKYIECRNNVLDVFEYNGKEDPATEIFAAIPDFGDIAIKNRRTESVGDRIAGSTSAFKVWEGLVDIDGMEVSNKLASTRANFVRHPGGKLSCTIRVSLSLVL